MGAAWGNQSRQQGRRTGLYFCCHLLQEIKCYLITFYPTELKVWGRSLTSVLDLNLSFNVQRWAPALGFSLPQKFSPTGIGGRRLFHESYLNADFYSEQRTLNCKWKGVHVWVSFHITFLFFFSRSNLSPVDLSIFQPCITHFQHVEEHYLVLRITNNFMKEWKLSTCIFTLIFKTIKHFFKYLEKKEQKEKKEKH